MLEPVALNQTRFTVPGVAPDNRGVVLGKLGALLFASVDRLVGFFRIFSDESSMDELLPKLKIHQVRTPLMSREFLVLYAASTSYLVDRASRIAALLGGLSFTGSGKHFVKYRDAQSPLGYDATALNEVDRRPAIGRRRELDVRPSWPGSDSQIRICSSYTRQRCAVLVFGLRRLSAWIQSHRVARRSASRRDARSAPLHRQSQPQHSAN